MTRILRIGSGEDHKWLTWKDAIRHIILVHLGTAFEIFLGTNSSLLLFLLFQDSLDLWCNTLQHIPGGLLGLPPNSSRVVGTAPRIRAVRIPGFLYRLMSAGTGSI